MGSFDTFSLLISLFLVFRIIDIGTSCCFQLVPYNICIFFHANLLFGKPCGFSILSFLFFRFLDFYGPKKSETDSLYRQKGSRADRILPPYFFEIHIQAVLLLEIVSKKNETRQFCGRVKLVVALARDRCIL